MFKFCDTFICCFARAEGSSILADRFPVNGPHCPANDITRYTGIFEQRKWGTIRNHTTKLSTPAGIRVTGDAEDVTRGERCSIGVGLSVMVCRKMVECLNCRTSSRVVAYTIFCCVVEVLESM
jgi:hypothetical protein